jgi:hypothetical protein
MRYLLLLLPLLVFGDTPKILECKKHSNKSGGGIIEWAKCMILVA